jgi:Uncharacterized conserved protein (DUF2190)
MAYTPVYFEADTLSDTTSATVTGGQLLYVSGNNTVAPTTAATAAWVGVAAFDAASGTLVSYYTTGVHDLAASGSIAAGDLVIPAAAGAVATQGTASAANDVQVVGVAKSAAAGGVVRVLLRS